MPACLLSVQCPAIQLVLNSGLLQKNASLLENKHEIEWDLEYLLPPDPDQAITGRCTDNCPANSQNASVTRLNQWELAELRPGIALKEAASVIPFFRSTTTTTTTTQQCRLYNCCFSEPGDNLETTDRPEFSTP